MSGMTLEKAAPRACRGCLTPSPRILGPSHEIVIVGKSQMEDTKKMLNILKTRFIPNKVVIFRPSQVKYPKISNFAKFTKHLLSREGKATAYVCHNFMCNLPTTSIEEMLSLLA